MRLQTDKKVDGMMNDLVETQMERRRVGRDPNGTESDEQVVVPADLDCDEAGQWGQ